MSERKLPQVIIDLQAVRNRLTNPEAWNQGMFGDNEGPNCIVGAIDRVIDRDLKFLKVGEEYAQLEQAQERRHNMRQALGRCLPKEYTSLVYYNDTLKTTHENILTLIDAALKSEKQSVCIRV